MKTTSGEKTFQECRKNMLMLFSCILLFGLGIPVHAQFDIDLPEIGGLGEPEDVKIEDIIKPSKKEANIKYKMPRDCDSVGFNLKMNFPGDLRVFLDYEDGSKNVFKLVPTGQMKERKKSAGEAFGRTKVEIKEPEPVFQNHILRIPELDVQYYLRPRFERYGDKEIDKKMAEWEKIPDAMTRNIRIDLRKTADGIRIFMDGRYAGMFPGNKSIEQIRIDGGTGPDITALKGYINKQSTPKWEVIDFGKVANTGAMKDAKISLKPGFQELNGVPFIVSDGEASGDLSLARATRGIYLLEVDFYLARDAFERLPESFLTSVPNGLYENAHILFALDPDPKKERKMTIRMTRLCDEGRGDGIFHNDVILPDDDTKFPDNIKKVGTVTLPGKDGKKTTVPLYEGVFPINSGEILDIINDDPHPRNRNKKNPYLDFELFGRRGNIGAYVTGHLKPGNVPTAFNIFGVTLQRAPLAVEMKPSQRGNIFANDEKTETGVQVTALVPGKYNLEWTITDSDGKEVKKDGIPLDLKLNETRLLTIPLLSPSDIGHYELKISLRRENDKTPFMVHPAMFAILGKDTRLATPAESPFGTWPGGAHHVTGDLEINLSTMNKAGIRRTTLKQTDEESIRIAKKYKITNNQLTWFSKFPTDNDEEAWKALEEYHGSIIRAYPDCHYALIFHESYGDPLPPEFFGEKVDNISARDKEFTKRAEVIARFFREKYPHIKLVYGNNTSSSGLTAALLRNNFDTKYFDFIGIETPGQGCIPERLFQGGTQGTWMAKETARRFGKNIPVTGCYEFSARPQRLLGMRKQAEYLIRDALIGLAYGYETLGIGGFCDVGNGYVQTLWGSDGLCTRYPEMYPKPLLSAYAAMTKVLDQIKFGPKILNTGSNSAYAIEFERKRGDIAYAFWMPLRSGEIEFTFAKDVNAQYVDFVGRTRDVKGKTLVLPISFSPGYLVAPEKALSVRYLRNTPEKIPASFQVSQELNDLNKLRVLGNARSLGNHDLFRTPGKFKIREVEDPEKGKCIELELIREGIVHDAMGEYTKIEFKKPIPVPGTPDEVAMWVKGDGGWGKIGFEFQDAEGRLFRSEGNWQDFGGETFINFTGWRLMRFPIDAPGVRSRLNVSLGGRWQGKDGWPVAFPIKLTGLYITLYRKALNPSVMTDNPGIIRLKDLGTITNPEFQLPEVKK